jgi:hypothetical protein
MSECLHCEINAVVEQHVAGGENDPLTPASNPLKKSNYPGCLAGSRKA